MALTSECYGSFFFLKQTGYCIGRYTIPGCWNGAYIGMLVFKTNNKLKFQDLRSQVL